VRTDPLFLIAITYLLVFVSACDSRSASDKKLVHVLRSGDTNEVSRFCREGGDPNRLIQNSPSMKSTAPLLDVAASYGQYEIVQILLAAKADPNLRDSQGWTPVMWAVAQREKGVTLDVRVKILKAIVSSGGDPNLRAADIVGWTPLCLASKFGELEMVNQLVALGADVNRATSDGQTPLQFAPNESISNALMSAGSR
jgi:ankyrin repeat protein